MQFTLLTICLISGKIEWIVCGWMFIISLALSLLFRDKMGGADYKIFIILSLFFGLEIVKIIFISALLGISCFSFVGVKQKLPFVPCITIGVIIFLFLKL